MDNKVFLISLKSISYIMLCKNFTTSIFNISILLQAPFDSKLCISKAFKNNYNFTLTENSKKGDISTINTVLYNGLVILTDIVRVNGWTT